MRLGKGQANGLGVNSYPLECVGGDENVAAPEGDGGFGEKDGFEALQSTGKPWPRKVGRRRCCPSRGAQVGLAAECFHHGSKVGVCMVFNRGFGRVEDKRQFFLRRRAVVAKVIEQVPQISHWRLFQHFQEVFQTTQCGKALTFIKKGDLV